MTIAGLAPVFLVACFGGLLAELVKWYQLKETLKFPAYVHNPVYWLITLAMVAAGGGIAVLYGVESKNALLVLQIGASTPLLVKSLTQVSTARGESSSTQDEFHGMRGAYSRSTEPSILNFLAGR